jgi:hypothetical protein
MKERGVEEVAVLFPADARDHTELSLRRKKIDKIDQIGWRFWRPECDEMGLPAAVKEDETVEWLREPQRLP